MSYKNHLIHLLKRLKTCLMLGVLIGLSLWIYGVHKFVNAIMPANPPYELSDYAKMANPDISIKQRAIIVLTGGSLRVDTGIDALKFGLGDKLFISGVYNGTDLNKILNQRQQPDIPSHQIELGYMASDTFGNAVEITQWVKNNHISEAYIITGSYHMPRSLDEISYRSPDLKLIPYPVYPQHVKLNQWYANWGTVLLLGSEYHKWLATRVKITFLTIFAWISNN